ncbi:MAG: L-threonylcarbamoyladenylate synthase [Acidimicrobiales bacterium]
MMVDLLDRPRALDVAVATLASGGVVALPTDTVYGLAVSSADLAARARVFAIKRRPQGFALPVLVASPTQAGELVVVDERAARLMERFWPGALTIVLEALDPSGPGGGSVGVRAPDHDFVLELCRRSGPLAVTSANLHGDAPATSASDVVGALGWSIDLVVHGPRTGTEQGVASTVVDARGPELVLLREGALAWDRILAASGPRSV